MFGVLKKKLELSLLNSVNSNVACSVIKVEKETATF